MGLWDDDEVYDNSPTANNELGEDKQEDSRDDTFVSTTNAVSLSDSDDTHTTTLPNKNTVGSNGSGGDEDARNTELSVYKQKLYDDIFTFTFRQQTELFIPLINESFGFDFGKDAKPKIESVTFFGEEFNLTKQYKKIADALISIGNNAFHFECESRNNEILFRIEEYDGFIAKRHEDKDIYTAVLYIRNNRLPENGYIESDNRTIPYINVGDYSLKDIIEKRLYMLLPYYPMRFEYQIKNDKETKYPYIAQSLKEMYNVLENAKNSGDLTEYNYTTLGKMCLSVIARISNNSSFREYCGKECITPMAFKTWDEELKQAERDKIAIQEQAERDRIAIQEQAERDKIAIREENLASMVTLAKRFCTDFESVYVEITKDPKYVHLTREEVRKYY